MHHLLTTVLVSVFMAQSVNSHDSEAKFTCSDPPPTDEAGLLLHAKRLRSCMDGNKQDCQCTAKGRWI